MSTSKAEGEEEISITLEHIPRHVRHIEIDLSEDNDDATATADQPKVGSKRSSEFERHELELESLDHPSHGQKKQKKAVEVEAHQTPNTILELREHTVHVHHPHRPPLDLRGTTTEKTKDERATEKVSTQALETGHIYFFYRPKVELSSATDDDEDSSRPSGLEDVQRFYLLLVPFDAVSPPSGTSPAKKKARLLVIGRKVLPGPRSGSDRKTTNNHWGYVDDVGDLDEIVKEKLSPQQYETVTRGVRALAGARPCGMGVYTIAKHRKSGYTHLAYVNELPSDGGEVQEVFNIRKEESFIFSVKNPLAAGFGPTSQPSASSSSAAHEAHLRGQPNRRLPGTMTSNDGLVSGGPPAVIQKPVLERYPEHLQKLFGPRRFLAVDPVELLDFKGAEFVLHAVSYSVANDLGTELGTDLETLEREEMGQKPLKEAVREKLYQQLHLSRAANPPNAILTGHWV